MPTISSLGVGSNLDLTTLLANLKSGEQSALVPLQSQQTSFTSKLTAYGQLSSALTALQTAATTLSKSTLYQSVKASSSDGGVLSASASASATSGAYAVNVTQLAQSQSLVAAGVASNATVVGGGTLTFDFGTLAGGSLDTASGKYIGTPRTFTADSARTGTVTIGAGNNTLAGIRDAINSNKSIGVTATIVNDGSASPSRLVLTSKQSGESSIMRISATDNAALPGGTTLTNLLANDPSATQNMQQTVVAQNAKMTVNGLAVTSTSNSLSAAIQDVSMTVTKIGASTLTLQNDTSSVQSAVTSFVNAYNSLQSVATRLSSFDATSKSGGILLGDSVLRNIQVRIRSTLTTAQVPDDSGLTMLSQIGVSFQKDGTLAIDSTKLTAALGSKLDGVANLFSGSGSVGGYGTNMATLISGFIDTDGTLSAATKGLNTSLDTLSKQYNAASDRIDATIARYKAQFTALDKMMNSMNATSTYLTQQFDAINNSTSK